MQNVQYIYWVINADIVNVNQPILVAQQSPATEMGYICTEHQFKYKAQTK